MIRVTIALPDSRKTDIYESTLTPKEILDTAGANYSKATVILDGCTMNPEGMNTSLDDLGVSGECTIAVCVKMDNA